jgi:hypothetical protein
MDGKSKKDGDIDDIPLDILEAQWKAEAATGNTPKLLPPANPVNSSQSASPSKHRKAKAR